MPIFRYKAASMRTLVTFTSVSAEKLEVHVGPQRFTHQGIYTYNFPSRPNDGQFHELVISAFLISEQKEEVSVRNIYSGDDEALFGVFAPRDSATSVGSNRLPDAYVVLVPYR